MHFDRLVAVLICAELSHVDDLNGAGISAVAAGHLLVPGRSLPRNAFLFHKTMFKLEALVGVQWPTH